MEGSGVVSPAPGQGGQMGFPSFKLGNREIKLNPARFSKTFFCLGPVCLRSGVGLGAGVGCGVGIIKGPMVPIGGESGNIDFLRQLPGGYQIMNVLQTVMRKFPGSKTGIGCGAGIGFGFGIGLAPAGGGGGGMGGMSMGGMGGGMGGMGGMGGTGGGMGGMGGMGQMGGQMGGMGGMNNGMGMQNQAGMQGPAVGAAAAGMSGGGGGGGVSENRIRALEDKVKSLEDKIGMQLKLKELADRISDMENKRRR